MGRRILAIVLPAVPLVLFAQTAGLVRSGAHVLTFRSSIDDSDQPYAIYLPKSFRADTRYPLVVGLHSELSNHRLHLLQILGLPSRAGQTGLDDFRFVPSLPDAGYIVACPFARGTMGYSGIAEADVYDMLAEVQRRFPINVDRLYLTGISMGGGGALRYVLTRPDMWAAVAPVVAAVPDELAVLAPNALNLPVRLFHGDQDPIVPVAGTRAWHRRLLESGAPAEYIEYPGIRHNAWDHAYRGSSLLEWFGQHRRIPYPDRVRFVSNSYRYASAYWVRIDGLTPGVLASIDARRAAAYEIRVETDKLDGFTLTLDREVSQVVIDGATLRVKAAKSLSFERAAGKWRAGRFRPVGKHVGAEGPVSEAVAGRQIYVYGTVGSDGADELAARRKVAEAAAAGSSRGTRVGLRFPVKADSEVTDVDLENSSLILFGTRQTNSLIARYATELPLELSPGAADYGLLFIVPVGKRYALVSSGLPWWSGGGDSRPGGDPFAPSPYRVLSTLGDFVLFKGGLGNVVAEGRFTREWKVPLESAEKMRASGTVTIH